MAAHIVHAVYKLQARRPQMEVYDLEWPYMHAINAASLIMIIIMPENAE
jgi:hypothetical protein